MHIVAGLRVGPRPAAPADEKEFADTAFSFICLGVSDVAKNRRGFPYSAQGLPAYIAALQVQVPARLHDAAVGNEHKGNPGKAAVGYGPVEKGEPVSAFALLNNSVEGWGAAGADHHIASDGELMPAGGKVIEQVET